MRFERPRSARILSPRPVERSLDDTYRTRASVTREGRHINLTPTEFRLLVFLARHPGQVLSRGQIMEQVWGHSSECYDDKTVNVHIRRLREKIEADPSRPRLILTVPGLGYRLAVPR